MKKSKLPTGVTAVKSRDGLFRLTVMICGKRYSEYYRPQDGLTQTKLESDLQSAIDAFRKKCENGAFNHRITDKSRFREAVTAYLDATRQTLRESTLLHAEYMFNTYLTPTLGDMKLNSIKPSDISLLLANLCESGGITGKPLKPTSVRRISASLSALFKWLVQDEILPKNPVTAAKKPTVGEPEQGVFLDNYQLPVFLNALDAIANDSTRTALLLCLQLGLRSGEARGLCWNVFVNQKLQQKSLKKYSALPTPNYLNSAV